MSDHPAPPTPTLLLLNLPPSILCGINLLSFTTSSTFLGIKNLPVGYHFVFTSPSQSLSLRDGFWFHTPSTPCPTIYRKWDPDLERLVSCSEDEGWTAVTERGGAQVVYEKFLTPYRQSAGQEERASDTREGVWNYLTKHIISELLDNFTRVSSPGAASPGHNAGRSPVGLACGNGSSDPATTGNQGVRWTISSASSGLQDRDEIPGLSTLEARSVIGEEQELGMLGIDLKKTWREGAVGRERTEQARDRSWLLCSIGSQVSDSSSREETILGQMELCFLMILTIANYSCLEEWKRILAMVLTCEKAVGEKSGFFAEFLRLLKRQLERVDDVEGGLFEMSEDGGGMFLKRLLKGFRRILDGFNRVKTEGVGDVEVEGVDNVREEFGELEKWVKEQYRWELGDEFARSGMLELEDGEMVEMETGEMEGEDESGEYAPVVVEL
ncbi:MAG: hypothetical protein Q9218_003297 [Villophora microphyllina]